MNRGTEEWLDKLNKDREWAIEQVQEQLEDIETSGCEATIEIKKTQLRLHKDVDVSKFEERRQELTVYVPEGPPRNE